MYQKLDRPKHAKERLKSLNNFSNKLIVTIIRGGLS